VPPVVETERLCKRYGRVVAVDDLSLSVPAGGVFGLLGPNGSGKTTTMSMLLGLVRPTSGAIRLFGGPAGPVTPRLVRRMGATIETPAFYPYLSGRDNLRYFRAVGRHAGRDEIERLLRRVDLEDAADRPFRTYSMGMKQRLGIAYTLLGAPDVVFLDEPTNGLDPAGVAEVRELIRSLGRGGQTVILSSHLLSEVQQVADSVAILSRGRLVAQGPVADLLSTGLGVQVKTTDDARAQQILAAPPLSFKVEMEDGFLHVDLPPERAWELTRALAEQGVYVAELAPRRASLERYFLEVTGETPVEAVGE
jgi:ABC-2 type transport system ATP-binding protein